MGTATRVVTPGKRIDIGPIPPWVGFHTCPTCEAIVDIGEDWNEAGEIWFEDEFGERHWWDEAEDDATQNKMLITCPACKSHTILAMVGTTTCPGDPYTESDARKAAERRRMQVPPAEPENEAPELPVSNIVFFARFSVWAFMILSLTLCGRNLLYQAGFDPARVYFAGVFVSVIGLIALAWKFTIDWRWNHGQTQWQKDRAKAAQPAVTKTVQTPPPPNNRPVATKPYPRPLIPIPKNGDYDELVGDRGVVIARVVRPPAYTEDSPFNPFKDGKGWKGPTTPSYQTPVDTRNYVEEGRKLGRIIRDADIPSMEKTRILRDLNIAINRGPDAFDAFREKETAKYAPEVKRPEASSSLSFLEQMYRNTKTSPRIYDPYDPVQAGKDAHDTLDAYTNIWQEMLDKQLAVYKKMLPLPDAEEDWRDWDEWDEWH